MSQLEYACGVDYAPTGVSSGVKATKLGPDEFSDFREMEWVTRGPAIRILCDQNARLQPPAQMLRCRALGTAEDGVWGRT